MYNIITPMSSSHLTEKNKLESMCNKLNSKDASNGVLKKKINNIRCIDIYDTLGNYVQKSWFDVTIPDTEFVNEFPAATIDVSSLPHVSPIMFPVAPATSIVNPQDGKTAKMLLFNRASRRTTGSLGSLSL